MKYQLTCPKCHYEFKYDNDYYDSNIARLGVEIHEIERQLAEHRLLPYDEQRRRTDWWLRAKKSLAEKRKEVAELKAFRKISDQQRRRQEYHTFKRLTRELVGEEQYFKIIEEMEQELKAYDVSGLMKHEYTRANNKSNITSINKL